MAVSLFPWLRAAHILFAAAWLGAGAFVTLYLAPAMREPGPAGDAMVQALHRRGMHRYMATIAGLTALSGLWLFWLVGRGAGTLLALGAAAGLLAAILGGTVIGRGFSRINTLVARPEAEPGRAAGIAAAHRRIAGASKLVLALMAFALLAMTVGHAL